MSTSVANDREVPNPLSIPQEVPKAGLEWADVKMATCVPSR
jgi:hypothetical protein